MKNKFLLIFTGILLASILVNINLASAVTLGDISCNPTIQLINQDPYPAVPDSYVKVLFEVSGLGSCNGFAVKLNPEYPFSLDPDYDPVQTLDSNPYAPSYKTSWAIPYKIRIASDALEGEYDLKLIYHNGNSKNFDSYAIEKYFNISITDAQTDFDAVVQESTSSSISLGIVNIGKNTANSLIVKIPQQENYRATGTSEQIIGNLAAGDYTIVSFGISQTNARNISRTNSINNNQNPSIPTDQMLKIRMDYTDAIGKRRSVIKEVQVSSSSARSNFTMGGNAFRQTSSSGISSGYIYLGIAVIAVIIIVFIYLKYFHKKGHEKNSIKIPDWILSEKTHHKK